MSESAQTRPGLGPDQVHNVRVLVLDDEEPIRRLTQTILTRAGCMVETASDGREGLQLLLQRDFDVALVDLQMPDMGGAEFLVEARSIWPWLGIVILTGHASADAVEHAQQYGVTRILSKPLDRQTLLQEVMAEAHAKRKRVEMSASHSLDRIQDQLSVLRGFSESAMAAQSLDEAMLQLSNGLSSLLPCAAVAILNVEGEQPRLYLTPMKPVHPDFLRALEDTLLGRYQALTGRPRPRLTQSIPLGPIQTAEDAPRIMERSFTVPIVNGRSVRGLLALAYAQGDAHTAADTSFIYHAANHLSTVLSALHRMRELSVRDALTGLYNRRGLQEEYDRAWQLARRYGYPIGLAVLDVDHFKNLNDSHGHPVGDEILKEFSVLLTRVARATDIVGRLGGDEMVVILQQAGPSDVVTFGERMCTAVRRQIFCEKTKGLKLSTSIGVAASTPTALVNTSEELFSMADRALYTAKKSGRDRVCIFQPGMAGPGDEPAAAPASATTPGDAPALPPAPRGEPKIKGRIMVVDDDVEVGKALRLLLQAKRYEVNVQTSALAAIELLASVPGQYDVLITDLSMPDLSGLDLLDRLRSVDDALVKIVITGHATLDNALTSLRRGAYDFVQKPPQPNHLIAVVDRAIEYSRLKAENRRYQLNLEEMVREKNMALREALHEIRQSYEFTLEAMVAMLDARERSTGQHSLRVRLLAVIMAQELGLSQAEVDDISHGALLHDIGKIAIPDAILLKPGKLTDEEWVIMKQHPDIGYRLLSSSKYLERACEIVRQHQESWDGSGYPLGLRGEEIVLGARIFAVVDAYDAMRSDRVYRKALSVDAAVAEIKRHAGRQFDPAVVDAFLRCQPEMEKAGRWTA